MEWSYFDKFDDISDKYLPDMGEGDSMAEQIVTAVSKLVYRYYNDGDVFDNSYLESYTDLSSYANWLYKYVPQTKNILDRVYKCYDSDSYTDLLADLADVTLDETFLSRYDHKPVTGTIYECEGPYCVEEYDEDEDDDEWYDEDDDEWYDEDYPF